MRKFHERIPYHCCEGLSYGALFECMIFVGFFVRTFLGHSLGPLWQGNQLITINARSRMGVWIRAPLMAGALFFCEDFLGNLLPRNLFNKSINHHKSKKQDGGLEQGPPHGWSAPQATKLSALESFDLYVRTHRFRPSLDPTHYLDIQNPIWV